jgi:hypothetical protein
MPATRFDGANDSIICSPGACGPASNAMTLVTVFRRAAQPLWQAMMTGENTARTTTWASMEISDASLGNVMSAGSSAVACNGSATTGPGTNIADYFLYAASRPSGTGNALPRFHSANLSTGATPNHENATSTITAAATAWNVVVFGEWSGADDANGWLVAAAYLPYVLSDAGFNAIATAKATSAMVNPNGEGLATGLWEFNALSVADLTGNGANESSRNGTSIDAAETPPWTFDGIGGAPVGSLFIPHRMPMV